MLIFALLPKNKKMEHLTRIQRYEISSKLEAGFSKVQIAKWLCMDRSTIYRELRRNSNQKTGVYDPELADKKYRRRMSEKPKRKTFSEEMRSLAAELLTKQLSPEQIKGRCDLLGVPMVSHERLYQFVWEDKKKGGELHKHLRRHGRKYRRRGAAKDSALWSFRSIYISWQFGCMFACLAGTPKKTWLELVLFLLNIGDHKHGICIIGALLPCRFFSLLGYHNVCSFFVHNL